MHFQNAFLKYSQDIPAEVSSARRFAERSVELDSLDPFANLTMGRSFWLEADFFRSFPFAEPAVRQRIAKALAAFGI